MAPDARRLRSTRGGELIESRPIASALGTELRGVDLREPGDDARAALRHALATRRVVLIRDQQLSHDELTAFALWWGPMEVHPYLPCVPGYPAISALDSITGSTASAEGWHFDASWGQPPSSVILLRGVELPPAGGNTSFVDAVAAARALEEIHGPGVRDVVLRHARTRNGTTMTLDRPLLHSHPSSGDPALLVSLKHTHGLDLNGTRLSCGPAELLADVTALTDDVRFRCEVVWAPGSIVLWDNQAVLHRVVNDFGPARRRMERIAIIGPTA